MKKFFREFLDVLTRQYKPEPIHSYSVYNLSKKEYFTHDYSTRADAYAAMLRYFNRHNLVLAGKEESTHCKEYDCTDGSKFFINREY